MICKIDSQGDVLNVFLDGEIDHHSARDAREQIDKEIEVNQPMVLTLDFKDVSFMDSSGIGLIMGRYKVMKQQGGEVRVANPSPNINRVLKLAGMDRLARIELI